MLYPSTEASPLSPPSAVWRLTSLGLLGVLQTQVQNFAYNGESDLDLEYAMNLVGVQQNITLYQVGDLVQGRMLRELLRPCTLTSQRSRLSLQAPHLTTSLMPLTGRTVRSRGATISIKTPITPTLRLVDGKVRNVPHPFRISHV